MPFSFLTMLRSRIKKARFGSSRHFRWQRCQLLLERLEERTVLATYQWNGAGGNAWETPGSWVLVPNTGTANPLGYPDAVGDVAQFFSNGSSGTFSTAQTPTINANDTITIGELDINSTVSSLDINGASSLGFLNFQNTSGSASINYEAGGTGASIIGQTGSVPISVPNGLSITYNSPVEQSISSNITAPNGGNATINASINAGYFLINGGSSSSISSNSTYTVSGNATFAVGANPAEIGPGATVVLNSGTTFRANSNSNGVTNFDENFVIGPNPNGSVTFGGYVLTLLNSTISLNGNDTILLDNLSSKHTTFDADFNGMGSSNSVTLTGTAGNGIFAGNTTFSGNPISLYGSALTVNTDVLTVNTPTTIQNSLTGSGELFLTGTSTLTLSGTDTYSGGSEVGYNSEGGTLIVDGSATAATGITVNQTGTLMGDGTVGAIIDSGGTVQPGDPNLGTGLGTLTASGASFTSGGTLVIQVTGAATSSAYTLGTNYDQLNLTSNGQLSAPDGTATITLNLAGLLTGGSAAGIIVDNGLANDSNSFPFVNIVNNPNPSQFQVQQPLDYTSTPNAVNLDIGGNPSITSAGSATFTVGSSSTFTPTAAGFPVPTLMESGPLPNGVTFTAGVLSGTPAAATARTYDDTITATNSFGSATQSFTLTVIEVATTTSLTDLSPSTTYAGTAVTFATAVQANGNPITGIADETVTLEDASQGSASIGSGTLNSNGSVTITVAGTTLAVGSHSIFAVYSGDTTFAASQSPALSELVLNSNATATSLADLGPNPSIFGGTVTFTTNVTFTSPVSGETVMLEDASNGNVAVGSSTLNSSGSATIAVNSLSVGSHSIFAVYPGDGINGSSTSTTAVQSVRNSTTTTLTDSGPNPSLNGQPITFTVGVSGGAALNGETVTLEDASNGNASVGSGTLTNGSATITVDNDAATLAIGSHSIFAVYSGDASFANSQSGQVVQTVNVATYEWTGAAGGSSWTNPGNWIGGVSGSYPQFVGDVAQFISGTGLFTTAQTPTVPTGVTITVGEIDIGSTVAVTIGGSLIMQNTSTPGVLDNENITTAATTVSVSITAPDGLNIINQSSAASTISSTITASNGLNILSDTTAASTISGNITANGGLNITQPSGATGTLTLSSAITAPAGLNATIDAGELLLNSAASNISSNSTYTVNSGGTLAAGGGGEQELGVGATVILNNGSTLRSNNTGNGTALENNFVIGSIGSSASIAITTETITLTNCTITLTGNDTVGVTATPASFNGVIINGAAPNDSLTLNGTTTVAWQGDSTFAGNPISLFGNASSLSGSDTFTVNTPTAIHNILNGTGSMTLMGNSPLTLSGSDPYAGSTNVEPGATLIVDGSVTAGTGITVYPTATLMGDGTVGAVAVNQGGGTVQPGDPNLNNGIGILTAASADLTNGGTLAIRVAGFLTPGTSYAQLNLGSGLNADGTSTITINLAGAVAGGIATIIKGTVPIEFGNVNILNLPSNLSNPTLDYTTPNEVNLEVSSAPAFLSPSSATFTVTESNTFTLMAGGYPTPITITPVGSVSLPSGVTFNAGVLSGTPAPGTAGVYHDTFMAANSLGSSTQGFTLTVNLVPSATTLTDLGPNPWFAGSSVTFTTAVTAGAAANGETVTLRDASNGNVSVGVGTLSNGSATIALNNLATGSHSIFAVYNGDATFAASQSADVVQVALPDNATLTSLKDSGPNPSLLGSSVTFTATVQTDGQSIAGETVTLEDASNGNASIGSSTINSSGLATITVSSLAVGSHSIFAVYPGDGSETGSQSTDVVQAVENSTTTTLTELGPNPSLFGGSVTFTTAVTGGTAVLGEIVTLYDASSSISVGSGTINTNGSATIAATNLVLGSNNIYAVYGGDSTHFGSQSNQVSQNVVGLLANISVLPPVETLPQFSVYWSGAAGVGWTITSYTVSVSVDGAAYTPWLTNTPLTSASYPGQNGNTYSFYCVVNGTGPSGVQTSPPSNVTSTTVPSSASLTVTSFTPTSTGFSASFSEPFLNTSTNPIHLYSEPSLGANYGPADITIVGPNGPVTGSLLVNATNTGFTFVKTNVATGGGTAGLLAPGTYTVTFVSGSTGFQDTNGNQLDSTGTGLAGNNYITTFTVTAPASNAVTVSIPDFARGPDSNDSINLINNTSNGIPITLSIPAGDSITSGSVTINYNTSQLSIAGAFPNPSLSGMSFTLSGSSSPGTAIVNFSTSTPLGSSSATVNVDLGGLIAYTPSTAAYKSYEVLQISSSLNGGAIPTINDNAVQVVAFLGNVSGNGSNPNGFDSGLMLNVASGLDAGFSQFPVIDPVIIGSLIGGESQLTTQDVLQLNLYNNTHSNPYVPFYPGAPSNNPAGPDPTLSIPTSLTVNAEGTVLVPVNIDNAHPAGSTGMTVAQLALEYDPTEFSVTPQDVQLGSVPESGTGWTLQAVVDASTGTIAITLYSETPIDTTGGGSLAVIALHELPTATPGATAIELVASATANGQVYSTSVNDLQGPFTLTPAPTNSGAAPGLEGTVVLPGASILPVAVSDASAEQVAALPQLSSASGAAPATPGIVPTAAISDAPVGIIEDPVENTAAALSDIVIEPDSSAPSSPTTLSADHSAAALAPSLLANANVTIEAVLANGYVASSAAGGNPLFSLGTGPQSFNALLAGAPGAATQAMQHPSDQLFQNIAFSEAGPALQDYLSDSEQPTDLLLQKGDEPAATDIGILDGCFAQFGVDGPTSGD